VAARASSRRGVDVTPQDRDIRGWPLAEIWFASEALGRGGGTA
jgi:hypothetical protein